MEPKLKNPEQAMRQISMLHGPRRYEESGINGAVSHIEPGDGEDPMQGGVWAWFVGSARAFRFGFTRSKSWAARKMRAAMRQEHEHQQIN